MKPKMRPRRTSKPKKSVQKHPSCGFSWFFLTFPVLKVHPNICPRFRLIPVLNGQMQLDHCLRFLGPLIRTKICLGFQRTPNIIRSFRVIRIHELAPAALQPPSSPPPPLHMTNLSSSSAVDTQAMEARIAALENRIV